MEDIDYAAKTINRGMKIKDLIKRLEDFDPESTVTFYTPSHDYWRTQLATIVTEVGESEVKWSEYHNQLEVNEEYSSEKGEELHRVVMLY